MLTLRRLPPPSISVLIAQREFEMPRASVRALQRRFIAIVNRNAPF